jgi:hypothetical protein
MVLLLVMSDENNLALLVTVDSELFGLLLTETLELETFDAGDQTGQDLGDGEGVDDQEDHKEEKVETHGTQSQVETERFRPEVHALEVHIETDLRPSSSLGQRLSVDSRKT